MSDEARAREALRALGIIPTKGLIRSWLQAAKAEEAMDAELTESVSKSESPPVEPAPQAPQPYRAPHPQGYSKSNLEPVLREQGTLQRPPGVRRRGRPRVIASWFREVARTMADGTPLREALKHHGITLNKTQVRALYRSREFKRLYQEERASAFAAENGCSHNP